MEKPKRTHLSFEKFANRGSLDKGSSYNNFFMYSDGGGVGDIYRQAEFFQRFAKEHPDMVDRLTERVTRAIEEGLAEGKDVSESLREVDRALYEAYLIMCGYGVSDEELFA